VLCPARPRKRFLLRTADVVGVDKAALKKEVLDVIVKGNYAPMYSRFCEELGWALDKAKLESMQKANAAEVEKLEEKIKDAEENLGESEVREAKLALATYLYTIGDKDKAVAAFAETEKKTVAIGQKMDLVFSYLRLGLYVEDMVMVKENIARAKTLFEEGGDWERKNRLKVYEGLFYMATREFKKAAMLFLDSIATFTTYELFPYSTFVFYTIVVSIVSLDRVTLKKKVVDTPEILTVIGEIPHAAPFLNCLYECKYAEFMKAFASVSDQIRNDMYLYPHMRYFMREIRVVAYNQFLESYKSVTMQSMATQFGVSIDFLDRELSSFIAAGRLNCKIDKVAGIIETNRPGARNALYQQVIKQGDMLLNRVQKLSKVIDME